MLWNKSAKYEHFRPKPQILGTNWSDHTKQPLCDYEEKGELITSVLTRNFISISLQDWIRCKTRIVLLLALPLPVIALTRRGPKKWWYRREEEIIIYWTFCCYKLYHGTHNFHNDLEHSNANLLEIKPKYLTV
jgi:hypothetical protein